MIAQYGELLYRRPLKPEEVTIAEQLKAAGYATGGFGKWGLGDEGTTGVPEKQGFDTFFGYYSQTHAHNYFPAFLVRNSEPVPMPGGNGPVTFRCDLRSVCRRTRWFEVATGSVLYPDLAKQTVCHLLLVVVHQRQLVLEIFTARQVEPINVDVAESVGMSAT